MAIGHSKTYRWKQNKKYLIRHKMPLCFSFLSFIFSPIILAQTNTATPLHLYQDLILPRGSTVLWAGQKHSWPLLSQESWIQKRYRHTYIFKGNLIPPGAGWMPIPNPVFFLIRRCCFSSQFPLFWRLTIDWYELTPRDKRSLLCLSTSLLQLVGISRVHIGK